jgi:hypothetical protein
MRRWVSEATQVSATMSKGDRGKDNSTSRAKNVAIIGFVVCAVLALGVIFLAHWEPRADFDIIGVLWIMQNILPFALFSILLAAAIGAASVWLRCKIRELREARATAK